jgi:hypothetical protein
MPSRFAAAFSPSLFRISSASAASAGVRPKSSRRFRHAPGRGSRRAERHGFGRKLIEKALLFCCERFPAQPIALAAQLHLASFYESFGFAVTSEPYDDFDVPHVDMTLLRASRRDPARCPLLLPTGFA